MTFKEWIRQTSREMFPPLAYEEVDNVMFTAMKVFIEEIISNRGISEIDIAGFGRFYVNRTFGHNGFDEDNQKIEGHQLVWIIHFKPSRRFKDLLNERIDIKDYKLAARPLIDPNKPRYKEKKKRTYRSHERKILYQGVNADILDMMNENNISKADLARQLKCSNANVTMTLRNPNMRKKTRKRILKAIEDIKNGKKRVRKKPKTRKRRKRVHTKTTRRTNKCLPPISEQVGIGCDNPASEVGISDS